jgi:hypothetical protein
LRDNLFTPIQSSQALFIPPVRSATLLRTAAAWERIGGRWLPRFAGVVLMEAGKQLYAATTVRAKRQRRPVIVPFPQPAAGRSSHGRGLSPTLSPPQ